MGNYEVYKQTLFWGILFQWILAILFSGLFWLISNKRIHLWKLVWASWAIATTLYPLIMLLLDRDQEKTYKDALYFLLSLPLIVTVAVGVFLLLFNKYEKRSLT